MPDEAVNKSPQVRLTEPPCGVVAALAAGRSIGSIAKEHGVPWRTANSWSERPEIVAEVEGIQAAMVAEVKRSGKSLIRRSVAVFGKGLSATRGCPRCDGKFPDMDLRLRAATVVADRFGLPKTTVTTLVDSSAADRRDDADLATDVLAEAVAIAEQRGRPDVARAIRSLDTQHGQTSMEDA